MFTENRFIDIVNHFKLNMPASDVRKNQNEKAGVVSVLSDDYLKCVMCFYKYFL